MAQHRTKSIISAVSDDDENVSAANSTNTNYSIMQSDTTGKRINNSHTLITSEIMDDFLTICLTPDVDPPVDDLHCFLERLKQITKQVEFFSDLDECIDYLTDLDKKRVVIVLYDYPDKHSVSFLSNILQVCSFYRFEHAEVSSTSGREKIKKFKGVYNDVEKICRSIKQDIHRQWFDSTLLSIISASSPENLDALDSSFMYTQLLREIIVDMDYDGEKARKEFVEFCRQRFSPLDCPPKKLDLFERTYELNSPMWWYTAESFIYRNLNTALRTQDTEVIMKMGFYIQDFYREAEQKQSELKIDSKMVVYRGQGLSDHDFEKLRDSKGGLLSFNNFLSTSRDRDVSLMYAEDVRDNTNSLGILFEMEINPSILSSTFLSLDSLSQFEQEREILFLMHSVFRIIDCNELEDRLWKVNLTLTDDSDQELNRLIQCLRDEIREESGWDRMAMLMQRLGKFDRALEIYGAKLEASVDDDKESLEIARAVTAISSAKSYLEMGKDQDAITNLEETLEIFQRYLSPDAPIFSVIHICLALAEQRTGNYAPALSNLMKGQEISQGSPSIPQSITAFIFNMTGLVHQGMGDYQLALLNFEKALEIRRTVLPHYHPDLTVTCNNIAISYQSMGDYSKALEYLNEALIIQQRSLPNNHPQLSVIYANIATINLQLQNYISSLEYCERAIENRQKSSTEDHPDMVLIYNSTALAHRAMNNHSAAFSNFDKALEIQRKLYPFDHPNTALIYINIGGTYLLIGNHSAAIDHFEKALQMQEKLLPEEHPAFALTYQCIGTVNYSLGNYPLALSYLEKALKIQQQTLPSHHPDLAKTYSGIALVHRATHEYLAAMSNSKNAIQSQQALLAQNQSTTDGSLDANDEDTRCLQSRAMGITEITRAMEALQKISVPTEFDLSAMTENIFESFDASLKGLTHTEESFRIKLKSVLLDRQLLSSNFDLSNARNQSVEEMQTLFMNLREQLTRMNGWMQKCVKNWTEVGDIDRDTLEEFDPSGEILNTLTCGEKLMKLRGTPADYIAVFFNNFGYQRCAASQYPVALVCFEKALETLKNCVPVHSQLVAKTHDHMATALEGLERIEEAIYSATQATETASSALGPDHPDTQAYQTHLDKLMHKLQFL